MTSTPLSRPSAASKQTVHNAGPGGAKPAWKSIAAGWSGAVLATGGYAAAADPRWWLPCMGCSVVGSLHARRALRAGRRTETAESARLANQSAAKVPVRQKVTWNRKKTHPRRLTLTIPPEEAAVETMPMALTQAAAAAWSPAEFTVTSATIPAGRFVLQYRAPTPDPDKTDLDRDKERAKDVATQIYGSAVSVDSWKTDQGHLDGFTIHHQRGAHLSSSTIQLRLAAVTSAMMRGQWRSDFDLERDTITVTRRRPLPSMVPRPVDLPGPDSPDWEKIPQAVDEDGNTCFWDISGVMAHQLKAGRTRTGKTVSMIGDAVEGARRNWRVFIVDPKRIEYLGLREWPNIEMVATTVPDQVALIHWLWSLMEERYRRIEEEGACETDFGRVLVLIDEYRQFYGNAKNWWSTIKVSGMPGECPVFGWIGSLLRMAAACRIHVDLGTQRPDAEFLGGEIRDNFSGRAATGPLSADGARMMFGSEHVGVGIPFGKRGRGTYLSGESAPKEVQFFYTPDPRKAHSPQDLELLDQLRPDTTTWTKKKFVWPTDEQIDETMASAGKKTSPEWERILGADLADDTETARSTPPEVTEEPDDPARDIDLLYNPPHPVAATELAAGVLINIDGEWVTITESSVDSGQIIVDWESAGDDSGTLMLGTQEAMLARTPLDPLYE